jgi:aminoglycoside phosphotransferase family enzyme/predicted kinase
MEYDAQVRLIRSLHKPGIFPHDYAHFQVIETHISWVILCGPYAYKIKKAVDLGFLDFTTLKKRHHFCEEELRLNRRLAPELYLGVVHFTGTPERVEFGGDGAPIEYAVKMARFPQRTLLSAMVARRQLTDLHIDHMVEKIADFHAAIPAADPGREFGTPARVKEPVDENFVQCAERGANDEQRRLLEHIRDWSEQEFTRREATIAARKRGGFVRECHGDMHLGNMAWWDDRLLIFDGIEFNPYLYWIDVMSEVAFLCMDLEDHGFRAFAYRFLNGYLERTGDYAGIAVLRYYLAYRAMVRAKVASIRLAQEDNQIDPVQAAELDSYLHLARRFTSPPAPVLLLTHGLSGSGKSTFTGPLAELWPAVRLRSDRERQRLFATERADAPTGIGVGIYSAEATDKTYARLLELADAILQAGFSVIVDATFLHRRQRDPFRQLAAHLQVPFRILHFTAAADVLRERVRARQSGAKDISEADLQVLEHQLATCVPPDPDEAADLLEVDTETTTDPQQLHERLRRALRH